VPRASEAAIGYREADRTRRSAKVGKTMVRPNQRRARGERGLLDFSRMPKRGSRDRAVVQRILDAAVVCHVAHLIGHQPVAMPTMHWRIGERVYWHGSAVSRMLRTNEAGGNVCLTATIIDGFVLARSGFNHSINYRSVLCFGTPTAVIDPSEKAAALEHFLEHWFPGRWAGLRPATRKELAATSVFWLPLDQATAKVRTGPPHDPAKDQAWPTWAGVVPLELAARAAEAAPDLNLSARAPRPRGFARVSGRRRTTTALVV
jgi:nitroimidazol reductase NimA-like FMN-containing flavoprotein (pyridoxamine 5'-phosphate oxidase superfamily)